jgi:hypothetical protein
MFPDLKHKFHHARGGCLMQTKTIKTLTNEFVDDIKVPPCPQGLCFQAETFNIANK